MDAKLDLNAVRLAPIIEASVKAVYNLCENNVLFYPIPFEFFSRGTIRDEDFDPNLSLIAYLGDSNVPIGCAFAVVRNYFNKVRKVYLKLIVVDKSVQRQGLGTKLLLEIMHRSKSKASRFTSLSFGDSAPRYWTPGVDTRHTALYCFLLKNGFKKGSIRFNMTVDLTKFDRQPKTEKLGYSYSRVTLEDKEPLKQFIAKNFSFNWVKEGPMGYENNPHTTFIAKDANGTIVGFAAHSVQFPGSFGPTGVLKTIRGKGIGGELFYWTMADMKKQGLKEATIQWIGPIEFYSKVVGAILHPVFYVMSKRL